MTNYQKESLLLAGIENGSFPQVLYKYRTVDQTKKILENPSFWFAKPDSFNDPFDCNLSECKTPSIDEALKYLKSLREYTPEHLNKITSLFQKEPDKLLSLVKETKQKVINNRGICSLSKKHNNILMWSHYADNHKGIVVGLDLKSDLDFFLYPVNVSYQDNYTELNYFKDPEESINATIRTKSSLWAYEEEIRIYKSASGLHKINKDAIKEIYFGINTAQQNIDEIRKLCEDQQIPNIQFYKGEKAHASFDIVFSPL